MSQYLVAVAIETATQSVAVADVAANIQVTLASTDTTAAAIPAVVLPVAAAPYVANFTVTDGTYNGTVQALRADGSAIGTPLTFQAVAASSPPVAPTEPVVPATAESVVPSSVTVTVTEVVASAAPAATA